ncbi:MAG: DUF354 domain-containing protein [Nanoarchaeota archaeon]|nr:DUF354 domain-containing protein [Nanoarchaeota archaeon]
MKIIIDILHPAHVHFFKYFIKRMREKGHQILITARNKEMTLKLLDLYGLKYVKISGIKKGKLGLLIEFLIRNFRFYKICKRFKPDILIGIMGPTISVVGKWLGIPSIIFYDTEHAKITNKFAYPLATTVCTPSCYKGKVKNQFRYPGYHELTYLHPRWFKPNKNILKGLNLKNKEKFFVVRFVSWGASHDIGQKGFNLSSKRKLISLLEKYGKVIITSENPLPKEFEKYRINVPVEKIHDLLNYTNMYVGEGGTMASEAAVLGTPSIYVNSLKLGYLEELENRYDLLYNFSKPAGAIKKVEKLLKNKNLKEEWQRKKQNLLKDKIDVTEWIIEFIEKGKYKKKSII